MKIKYDNYEFCVSRFSRMSYWLGWTVWSMLPVFYRWKKLEWGRYALQEQWGENILTNISLCSLLHQGSFGFRRQSRGTWVHIPENKRVGLDRGELQRSDLNMDLVRWDSLELSKMVLQATIFKGCQHVQRCSNIQHFCHVTLSEQKKIHLWERSIRFFFWKRWPQLPGLLPGFEMDVWQLLQMVLHYTEDVAGRGESLPTDWGETWDFKLLNILSHIHFFRVTWLPLVNRRMNQLEKLP